MRTAVNRLFLLLVLIAALFIMASHTASFPADAAVCDKEATTATEAGSIRLWESLSHQFVSLRPF